MYLSIFYLDNYDIYSFTYKIFLSFISFAGIILKSPFVLVEDILIFVIMVKIFYHFLHVSWRKA